MAAKQYMIIAETTVPKLEASVNAFISEQVKTNNVYEPIGGVTFRPAQGMDVPVGWVQALKIKGQRPQS